MVEYFDLNDSTFEKQIQETLDMPMVGGGDSKVTGCMLIPV